MKARPTVLFLSHDASRTGAPIQLLHLLRWLRRNADFDVEILLRSGGPMEKEFRELGPVTVLRDQPPEDGFGRLRRARRKVDDAIGGVQWAHVVRRLARGGISLVYSNTITNGAALERLARLKCPVLSHVHEIEPTIRLFGDENVRLVREHTTRFVACAEAVRSDLVGTFGVRPEIVDVVYGFVDPRDRSAEAVASMRASQRAELGIPADAFVVGACGATDWRKGADVFVQLARACKRRDDVADVHFIWIGGAAPGERRANELAHDLERLGLRSVVHFIGRRPDAVERFAAFDVFALVSREDPFPLVCLEAAAFRQPVLCFDRAGGEPEFVEDDSGFVSPYLDVEDMAARIAQLASDPQLRRRLGERGMRKVDERYRVTVAGPRILGIVQSLL